MDTFRFDGHFHADIPKLERTLSIGMARGMNGLIIQTIGEQRHLNR